MPNPFFMLIFLFLIMLALKPETDPLAASEQIADLSRDCLDAYLAGDIDALSGNLHDEAVIVPYDQPTVRGEAGIRDYFKTRSAHHGLAFATQPDEVRINGGWGYARGRFARPAAAGSADTNATKNGRYLVLCVNVNGAWKMLHAIESAVPAPAD